jgi:hypothetical protein
MSPSSYQAALRRWGRGYTAPMEILIIVLVVVLILVLIGRL